MAKHKKRKRSKAERNHDQHHQAVHEYILKQIEGEDTPTRIHVMPTHQPWHVALPWCFCQPRMTDKHPLTDGEVWSHNGFIH